MNNRILLLPVECLDGEFSANVLIPSGSPGINAWLIFRYRNQNGFYSAGLGGYERKAVINIQEGMGSEQLNGIGTVRELSYDHTYNLRVTFSGDRFELFLDGVSQCVAVNPGLSQGFLGLKVNGSNAAQFTDFVVIVDDHELDKLLHSLRRFPFCLKREPERPKDERHVQRILWTMLRAQYNNVEDEEVLERFGLKHYKNDFGIPSLPTIIEAKFHRRRQSPKQLQEELMVDVVGYLSKPTSKYRNIIFFIYNTSGSALDSVMAQDLKNNLPVLDVVEIVC